MSTIEENVVAARGTAIVKVVFASLVGTAVEWYDFFLYGSAAALVFGTLFFPESDPVTATLLAFGTYALGFVARPLGGVVFGHFGDRVGRKKMLVVALMMMGVATFAIGLLPTYASIGIGAPILLLVCRLVQGFAVGGEWGGAVLMAAEHGKDDQRGFWSSWPQAGVPLAAAPGNPLRADLKANDMRSWTPAKPMLLCGGDQDPTVFFSVNTGTMQAFWAGLPAGLVTVLDVNATPNPQSPFAPLQVGFQTTLANLLASGGQEAVVENYHTTVAPFCTVAARGFFSQF